MASEFEKTSIEKPTLFRWKYQPRRYYVHLDFLTLFSSTSAHAIKKRRNPVSSKRPTSVIQLSPPTLPEWTSAQSQIFKFSFVGRPRALITTKRGGGWEVANSGRVINLSGMPGGGGALINPNYAKRSRIRVV